MQARLDDTGASFIDFYSRTFFFLEAWQRQKGKRVAQLGAGPRVGPVTGFESEEKMNDQERTWLNNADHNGGSFVSTFAKACFCAGDENFRLLRPVLETMMHKYPAYAKDRVSA
jgi:hypothetical protein